MNLAVGSDDAESSLFLLWSLKSEAHIVERSVQIALWYEMTGWVDLRGCKLGHRIYVCCKCLMRGHLWSQYPMILQEKPWS